MRKSLQIGGAYIGLVVGAGFASGQEILQFFTSYGAWGIVGAVMATILFVLVGMRLAQLGSRLQTTSHKDVIYHICGKSVGQAVDLIITLCVLGVTVVMIAAAGAVFEQQFGLEKHIGSLIMIVFTILSVVLHPKMIITLVGSFTPAILIVVFILSGYSLFTMEGTVVEQLSLAAQQVSASSHWLLSAFLYASYNIASGASMLAVMGGSVKQEKVAVWGGAIGGIGLGILIILINVSMVAKMDVVAGSPMPMLLIAKIISPWFGLIMAFVLLGLIYNTAVGMLYAFCARLTNPSHARFNLYVGIFGIVAFFLSFADFATLVSTLYPVMGYLGFLLVGSIIFSWIWRRAV
ncbi:hypothetical protein ACFOZY_08625 [Chungangia koreensis]|uniref:Membrane protein YkvI n=1 Tax=Chungangia koreensis TaxID=752657 RepID=A0ABV8X7B2_9LACT